VAYSEQTRTQRAKPHTTITRIHFTRRVVKIQFGDGMICGNRVTVERQLLSAVRMPLAAHQLLV
jgi:hypothetical protein